jgi:hypothetical protein
MKYSASPSTPLRRILIMVVLVSLSAMPILAAPDSGRQSVPTLGKHAFMTTPDLEEQFVRTTFRSSLGVGTVTNYQPGILQVDENEVIIVDGAVHYANLEFEYSQAVNSWLAVYLKANVVGRLGTGLKAVLLEGVRSTATTNLGWLARIKQTDNFYLSGSLGMRNTSTTQMDPLRFINGVVEDGVVDDEDRLIQTTPSLTTVTSLRFAYGFSEILGLIGFAEVAGGDPTDRSNDSVINGAFGLGFDVSLQKWIHVPVSVLLGYRTSDAPHVGREGTRYNHDTILQLGYLSPGGFIIALDIRKEWYTNVRDKKHTNQVIWPLLTMRYYF